MMMMQFDYDLWPPTTTLQSDRRFTADHLFSDVLDESDEHFCASTILRTINKEQLATTALFSVFFCCKKGFGFVTTIFLLPTLQTLVRVCMSCARRTLVVFGVFCMFLWMLHDGPKKVFWYEIMKILIARRRHMQIFYVWMKMLFKEHENIRDHYVYARVLLK